MSDTLTFAELEGQHVELLPARTVLSGLFSAGGHSEPGGHDGHDEHHGEHGEHHGEHGEHHGEHGEHHGEHGEH